MRFNSAISLVQTRGDLFYRESVPIKEAKNVALVRRELTDALADETSQFLGFEDFIRTGLRLCHLEYIIGVIR